MQPNSIECIVSDGATALPLWLVSESELAAWKGGQPPRTARWIEDSDFRAEKGRVLLLPGEDGKAAGAVIGMGALGELSELSLWHLAGTGGKLPPGDYRIATPLPDRAARQAALGFVYGEYRFDRYRGSGRPPGAARLVLPEGCDAAHLKNTIEALTLARDLINTPAADMGPAELAAAARELAAAFDAEIAVIEGGELLSAGYPAIHAVGRASSRAPRLIDLRWGDPQRPRVTLVGKGVCFDTGGLDLKNAAAMLLMKKDMGGAACTLALARMVMQARLPVRLRVLIPAVDNSVSADAFRPGDILRTRKGLTVEVGNTDAEGRLVLCDALAEADSEEPDLLIDMATLTGAARVALGPELPALYGSREEWVAELLRHGRAEHDPLWPMPLWESYEEELSSKLADLNNVSAGQYAGSVLAALFLKRFVSERTPWLHIDLFAWNARERPGRPVGAEPQCVRALFALLAEKYA